MSVIKNLLLFVILLSVIISIHELGHLLMAKLFNVYCKEYAIGMGPKIFSYKGKETEYSLRAIPIGGFVAMAGDDDNALETKVDTTSIPFERTLKGVAKWKRILIMLAGITMNMLLAIFIYSMIILNNGYYVKSTKPVITQIVEKSPAEKAGLQNGDLINSISFENGLSLKPESYVELSAFISTYDGNGPWTLTVDRENETLTVEIEPEYREDEQRYMIGIGFSDAATETVKTNIFNCFIYGFKYTMFIFKMTLSAFASLFKGRNLDSLSGPIGIYNTVAETSALGFEYYAQLIAMISVNLAIVNALPLPVLDGGRVLLLVIEMIKGSPLSEKAENAIMSISVALLLTLMLYVTYHDVIKLIGG